MKRSWPAAAALLSLVLAGAGARAQEVDAQLNETVTTIAKKGGLFTMELETTLYKPDGDGPFPVAVINHGKEAGDTRFQGRYRPAGAARWFLQRGYAVVVPMRQGFSKSSGNYIGGGCNVESNGRAQAEDVKAVLDWVRAQPWADKDRILVLGQSHGGWTTLAFGEVDYPGVKGLVNFAGGLRQDGCPQWKEQLASAAGKYALKTKVPTLWFYGDNDSFFDAPTWRAMHEQYTGAGARAQLVAFGTFGSDAHSMFASRAGARIWQPQMESFLQAVGLPHEVQPALAKYAPPAPMAAPPATGFAALQDETKVPFVKDNGRAGYKTYLAKSPPRAFAVAPNGSWGWAEGGDDPLQRALTFCNRNGKGECRLYSVDDQVVWSAP